MMSKWQANLLLIVAAISSGSAFLAVQLAIEHVTTLQMQSVRFFISSLLCLLIFYKGIKKTSKATMLKGCIIGIFFFLALTLENTGLETTTIPKSSFISVTYVIWVPLMNWLIYKIKPSRNLWLGIAFMIVGFFFLLFDIDILNIGQSLNNLKSGLNFTIGDFLTLLCSFAFTAHFMISNKLVKNEDTSVILTFQVITSFVLSTIATFAFEGNLFAIEESDLMLAMPSILFMAVICTIVAFGANLYAQKFVSSSNTAIIMSTTSLFASLIAVMFGRADITSGLIIGSIIITLGIVVAENSLDKKVVEPIEI